MRLHNKYDKETLKKRIQSEPFERITLSFYRYVSLENPTDLRDKLFAEWGQLGVLGRIYLAKEGINAQLNVPEPKFKAFIENLNSRTAFKEMPLKKAIEDDKFSFLKLTIKVKNQIVADGLSSTEYDVTNVGKHLTAKEFNAELESPETIVVDMRNHYESEVGHFVKAILPEAETFKEELPMVLKKLKGKEDKKILMYCTGGIRCEKASAYLRHHGFNDVNQLYGGIINYKQQVEEEKLENKFIGKNFVFDERLGERVTNEVIAKCHQCGDPCDIHTNCENVACNLLFIQCENCKEEYQGCCTPKCMAINALPKEEQKELRKGKEQRKRFQKGLQNPDELRQIIKEQKEKGFSLS